MNHKQMKCKRIGRIEWREENSEIYSYIIYLFFILNSERKIFMRQWEQCCVPPFNFIIPLIYFGTLKIRRVFQTFASLSIFLSHLAYFFPVLFSIGRRTFYVFNAKIKKERKKKRIERRRNENNKIKRKKTSVTSPFW